MGQINPLFVHFTSTQTRLRIQPLWRSPAGHLAQDKLIFLISPIMIYLKILQTVSTKKGIIIICYLLYLIMNQDQLQKNEATTEQSQEGCCQKVKNNKKIVFRIIIVCLGIVCFSLSIFAMSAAVTYFSYIFSITTELIAKAYLKQHYGWFMATTYISIFGFVIVVANTIVFFTEFSQKERILWIHIIFYLSMFISGIVALAGGAQHLAQMTQLLSSPNCANNSQCQIAIRFLIYRSQVTSYFIGYCITFFAYAAVYHYASYLQKRDKEEAAIGSKVHLNNTSQIMDNKKNISVMSNDQNSL